LLQVEIRPSLPPWAFPPPPEAVFRVFGAYPDTGVFETDKLSVDIDVTINGDL